MGTRGELVSACVRNKPFLISELYQVHELTSLRNRDLLKILNLNTFLGVFNNLQIHVCCRLFNIVRIKSLVISRFFCGLTIIKVPLNVLFEP